MATSNTRLTNHRALDANLKMVSHRVQPIRYVFQCLRQARVITSFQAVKLLVQVVSIYLCIYIHLSIYTVYLSIYLSTYPSLHSKCTLRADRLVLVAPLSNLKTECWIRDSFKMGGWGLYTF